LISKWRGTKRAGLEKRGVEGWLNPGLGGVLGWILSFLLSLDWWWWFLNWGGLN